MSIEKVTVKIKILAPHIEDGAGISAEEIVIEDVLTRFPKDWIIEILEHAYEIEIE